MIGDLEHMVERMEIETTIIYRNREQDKFVDKVYLGNIIGFDYEGKQLFYRWIVKTGFVSSTRNSIYSGAQSRQSI